MAVMSDFPIDMSLRLWSDYVPLHSIPELIEMGVKARHERGKPILNDGCETSRIARRHYVSLAHRRGRADSDVESWMAALLAVVGRDSALSADILSGNIEAVFWIALLGRERLSDPKIPQHLVRQVGDMNGRIFIENYTDLVAGNPRKSWLPAAPLSQTA